MSNPGVIELTNVMISGENLRIEDNIGEAIHIHYGNIRIDMTIKEFVGFAAELLPIMQNMVDVESFSPKDYDAAFLTDAGEMLCDLTAVEFINVAVDTLKTDCLTDDFAGLIPIGKARITQALHGDSRANDARKQKNYWGESNADRLTNIYASIAANGYNPGTYGNYIVLIDNGRYIIDGCHRASSILEQKGAIPIPVAMWHTKGDIYTDENKEEVLRNDLSEKRLLVAQTKNRRCLVSWLIKRDLTGKSVIIKGAGKHTQELIPLLRRNSVHIIGITAAAVTQNELYGLPFINAEELGNTSADAIIVSSWKYRREMKQELQQYASKFLIYDIYDEGIDREFFL